MQTELAMEKERTWPHKQYRLFHTGNKIGTKRALTKVTFSEVKSSRIAVKSLQSPGELQQFWLYIRMDLVKLPNLNADDS